MLVGELILNSRNFWNGRQDAFTHLVHGVLDRRAIFLRESLHCDRPSIRPRLVKLGNSSIYCAHSRECLPGPCSVDIRRQDSVPNFWECGIFVANEAVECRAGALQHQQANNAAPDIDTLALLDDCLNIPRLVSVAVEGVWVWLSVNGHSCPAVRNDADIGGCDVGILFEEVGAENACIELGRSDWVLLRLDVNGVLD